MPLPETEVLSVRKPNSCQWGRVPVIPRNTRLRLSEKLINPEPHVLDAMSDVHTTSLLASVLADVRSGLITATGRFRRYAAYVRSSAIVGGNEDSRVSTIFYEVGRVSGTVASALAPCSDKDFKVDSAYPTSVVLSEEFAGLAKKYTNFSATFAYSSLASVAERLARGLATISTVGGVDSSDLRGGMPLRIQAINTYDGPVNSLTNTVFIPRLVNSEIGVDVFSVLVNAVAGEGGSVATDILELDATTRQPVLGVIDGAALSRAIVEALRIIGSNMVASDQGPLFALAVTRGIHKTVTVVSHTDEGGVVRDLLRCGSLGVPFGGIHYSLEPYAGLPALASNGVADNSAFVDSIALMTAGLVAHCDPGQQYGSRWFPTFFQGTTSTDIEVRPGEHTPGTDAMALRNRSQLLGGLTPFASNYTQALGKLFYASGNHAHATSIFTAVSYQLGTHNRHLAHASVTPYFWIEPTSLIPADFLGSAAEVGGAGAFVSPNATKTGPAWEDIRKYSPGEVEYTSYVAEMRFPRACWFFAHWNSHPAGGLGALRVKQLDPTLTVQPGRCETTPQVRDRVEANLPFSDYLWTRGQSPFCAPGEFLNLGGTIGFLAHHYTVDEEGIPTLEHLPASREFGTTSITLTVSRPRGLAVGPSNWSDSFARRARTRATRELAGAAARVRVFGRADVAAMPTMTSVAVMPSGAAPHTHERARDHDDGGAVRGWARSTAGAPRDSPDRGPTGEPVLPTPQHQSVRWPQPARIHQVAVGGGPALQGGPDPVTAEGDGGDDVPVAPQSTGAALPTGPTPA